MNSIILYYSETGNTKIVAEKIANYFKFNIACINDFRQMTLDDYDLILFGTPVHGDNIPEKVRSFFDKYDVLNKKFAVYCIHAGPESLGSHAKCLNAFEDLINTKKGEVIGRLNLLGENKNREVIEWLKINMPDRYKNISYSKGHPDKDDFNKAILWFEKIINKIKLGD